MTTKVNLKNIIWPIENHELKKFLPMTFMMMCILFNYAVLRSIKDSLIVVTIGAEAIGFMKLYVVLPSAIIAMIAYAKLCNVMNSKNVFYTIVLFFIAYFLIFALVLYPHPELVHPNAETIERLSTEYDRFKWFIKIIGKWSYASFYVMAELWGAIMVALLFWQFANSIIKTEEAKRFYSMFGLLGNIGLPIAGLVLGVKMTSDSFLGININPTIATTQIKVLITALSACLIMLAYYYVNEVVLVDPAYQPQGSIKSKKSKTKLSLGESFKLIFSSKYLGMIAILIFAYGVSINLVESVWKAKAKELYATTEQYQEFMGYFQTMQGFGSMVFMIIGSNILRSVSWKIAAMLTPLMVLLTGLGFFGFIFFDKVIALYVASFCSAGPLALAVSIGTWQQVLAKGTKYSLFDSTKEMAYIPLDDELKSKGKAAVDVVGGRLGKSGGAAITSTFFLLFPQLGFSDAIPYFAVIFFVVVMFWLYSVGSLSSLYTKKIQEQDSNS
jgi:AAA family ATP:ADP antiporter